MTDVIAGRFALCDPIARGGSGVVWRAYDRRTGRFCAAKVLRRRDAGDLLRFVREQSVRMSHEHVLTPYSWAAEDAHVVIASELVDGGSVSALLGDHGPLAEGTVAVLLDQVLVALEEVHRAGLVHRDVKPANLLLHATRTGPLHVVLADFGLALGADDAHLTQIGTVVGTPGYLAPELLRGGVVPDPRHDLYAAGRVAAALAAGTEPAQIGTPTDLGSLRPGPLRETVAALASPDPRARPASAAQARAMLAAAARDPLPLTRRGDAIDVLHQLPPLSELALAEAAGRSGSGGRTGSGGRETVPDAATATRDLRTAPAPTPPLVPGATLPRTRAARVARPPRRRGRLLAGAAVLVLAGVGIPAALALTGDDSALPPRRPTTGAITTGGTFSPQAERAGDPCGFTDEGDTRAGTGGTITCVRGDDGRWRWTAR